VRVADELGRIEGLLVDLAEPGLLFSGHVVRSISSRPHDAAEADAAGRGVDRVG
jgi:hypothetical protein